VTKQSERLTNTAVDNPRNTILPLSRLRNIGMEMGYQCNVRCSMCSQVDFRPRAHELDDILIERVLPALTGADTLTISGGEPTIMPAALRLLRLVMQDHPHLKLISTTNGMLFHGVWDEAFIRQGISLNVSLNAIDPAIYSRIVQFGNQTTVIQTIDRLVRLRDQHQSNLKIRLSSVITDDTVHELEAFIRWSAAHRVDEVTLATDQIRDLKRYPAKAVQGFVTDAYRAQTDFPEIKIFGLPDFDADFARKNGLSPVKPKQPVAVSPAICGVPFDSIFVNPYGYVYPCPSTSYYFGNLAKQSIAAVWNSRAAQKFRQRMAALDCRDCLITCPNNARPVGNLRSQFRRTLWIARRDPLHTIQKGLRKFGLTSAQINSKN
jgi:MoaA/NifB/PqqE/SkfB family radical SAM enzyme